jgi:hypothetical protein
VHKYLKQLDAFAENEREGVKKKISIVKSVILTECVARTLKNMIRCLLRERTQQTQQSNNNDGNNSFASPVKSEHSTIDKNSHLRSLLIVIKRFLSPVLNTQWDSEAEKTVARAFWERQVKAEIESRYAACLTKSERVGMDGLVDTPRKKSMLFIYCCGVILFYVFHIDLFVCLFIYLFILFMYLFIHLCIYLSIYVFISLLVLPCR